MYSAVGWVFYPGNDKENKSNEREIVFDDFKIKPFLIVNYFLFLIGMALAITRLASILSIIFVMISNHKHIH